MAKTKNPSSSKKATKLSKANSISQVRAAFTATLTHAKNNLIARIACATLLLVAMWSFNGIGAVEGVQYGMLYMIAENAKKSGRADGNVYMRNGRIRGMAMPSNPQTAYQTAQRSNLGTLSSGWASLTPTEQESWNNLSFPDTDRFGRTVNITGKAAYVALNRNLYNTGDTAITTAPVPTGVPSPSSLSFVVDDSANTFLLTFAPDPIPAGYSWLVFATAQLSPGIYHPSASAYRLITSLAPGVASGTDINTEYASRFGAPVAGNKIFIKIVAVSKTTGFASAAITASSIVVA